MPTDSNVSEIEIRVRYCECDPMGYLHHAKYFEYLEVARTELLRNSTISYRQLEERGRFLCGGPSSILDTRDRFATTTWLQSEPGLTVSLELESITTMKLLITE